MKKIFLSILIGIMSCQGYTDGINENPNAFGGTTGAIQIGTPMLASVAVSSSDAVRYFAIFSDQMSGCDRQYETLETYSTTASDSDAHWSTIYYNGISQTKVVREKAKEDGNAVLEGVTYILEALFFGEATAIWGDVPFSETGNVDEYTNPKYDSQASVLSGVQKLLDDGISKVGSATVNGNYGGNIFVSNDATWVKVAHSLKARYYLLAKDYANALISAKQGIQSPTESLLSIHSGTEGKKNLYYQFIVEQRNGYLNLCKEPTLLKMLAKSATDSLTEYKTRTLATPGDSLLLNHYFSGKTDSGKWWSGSTFNTDSGGVFAQDASTAVIDFNEVKLIEAEAEQRSGSDINANTALNAVRTQLVTTYTGATVTDFPSSSLTGDDLLKAILEEKYLLLFGSAQPYYDIRRTDNLIGVDVKSNTFSRIPDRLLYPQSEINANKSFPGQTTTQTKIPVNN